eukprot:13272907-Alexandrium_andersonii.AAC.1
MAEGDIQVSDMIKEIRRYAGLRRAEARLRRNDDDMDVGAIQAPASAQESTPSTTQEAPPAARAWGADTQAWGDNQWEWEQEGSEDIDALGKGKGKGT